MDIKTKKKNNIKTQEADFLKLNSNKLKHYKSKFSDIEIVNICDENLTSLQKIHAILLNCTNLSKKQKLEFCESERYFMKLYLNKLKDNDDNI